MDTTGMQHIWFEIMSFNYFKLALKENIRAFFKVGMNDQPWTILMLGAF